MLPQSYCPNFIKQVIFEVQIHKIKITNNSTKEINTYLIDSSLFVFIKKVSKLNIYLFVQWNSISYASKLILVFEVFLLHNDISLDRRRVCVGGFYVLYAIWELFYECHKYWHIRIISRIMVSLYRYRRVYIWIWFTARPVYNLD